MNKKSNEQQQKMLRSIWENLGVSSVSDLSSDLNFSSLNKVVHEKIKNIFEEKRSSLNESNCYYYLSNKMVLLITLTKNNLIVYEMPENKFSVYNKDFSLNCRLTENTIETPEYEYDHISKKISFINKLNNKSIKISNISTVAVHVKGLNLQKIELLESGDFLAFFSGLPFSILKINNSKITQFAVNKKAMSFYDITDKYISASSLSEISNYFKPHIEMSKLIKDKTLYNMNLLDIQPQLDIANKLIENLTLLNSPGIRKRVSSFPRYKMPFNASSEQIKDEIKSYKIEKAFINYSNHNIKLALNNRNALFHFINQKNGFIPYLSSAFIDYSEKTNLLVKESLKHINPQYTSDRTKQEKKINNN